MLTEDAAPPYGFITPVLPLLLLWSLVGTNGATAKREFALLGNSARFLCTIFDSMY